METMTPKERIDAVIKHQAVDRTPFTVVDGGAWIAKTEGVTYRELYSRPDSGASSVVDYLNKIDSDMISAVSGVFTACLNAFGCPISIDKIGGAIDTGSVFKDPINEIPQLNKPKGSALVLPAAALRSESDSCRYQPYQRFA